MTADQFRRLALNFPEACESAHMSHPDFRVAGRIFATLGYPDNEHGMVVLPAEEQERFVRASPIAFAPAKGAWGKRGSTTVFLEAVDTATLKRAMEIAWRNKAPKDLL
ncbi:MAG TPA: MmcQ/YjbR family DNA-binding protein [Chthoniobacterales bacterium]|nr:MmcQ/YjbR family DNA-binding protein [Chthoniobacterales bacterium]